MRKNIFAHMHIQRISLESTNNQYLTEKTIRKECNVQFLATEEYFDGKNPAQRKRILPLEFSFLLYLCSILLQ